MKQWILVAAGLATSLACAARPAVGEKGRDVQDSGNPGILLRVTLDSGETFDVTAMKSDGTTYYAVTPEGEARQFTPEQVSDLQVPGEKPRAEKEPEHPLTEAETAEARALADKLGNAGFAVREAATNRLIEMGGRSPKGILALLPVQSEDHEVRARCETIRTRLDRQALPAPASPGTDPQQQAFVQTLINAVRGRNANTRK